MGSVEENRERTYPLIKPEGHKVPIPRWSLKFNDPEVTHLYTLYVGVQSHQDGGSVRKKAEEVIDAVLQDDCLGSPVVDTLRVTDGFDLADSKVWIAYWTKPGGYAAALRELDLERVWTELGEDRAGVGLWLEHFSAPIERLETNYARLDHKPGLAQLPDTEQPPHDLTAYWGAGRDRIPASAHDQFKAPEDIPMPSSTPSGFGEKLTGTNYEHMCHIRSGQWWQKCGEEERAAYETSLQAKLMAGMAFLWEHPRDTGTIGLRFLQNLDKEHGTPIRETCGAGFHRNWADLERWSSRDPSHLAIFNGMMAHAKRFGDDRKFMTWHEVWVFKAGEAKFEYVNCDPKTGVIGWVELESKALTAA